MDFPINNVRTGNKNYETIDPNQIFTHPTLSYKHSSGQEVHSMDFKDSTFSLPPSIEDPWLEPPRQIDPVPSNVEGQSNFTSYHSGTSCGDYYSATPGPNEQYFDSLLDLDAQPRHHSLSTFKDRQLDEAIDTKFYSDGEKVQFRRRSSPPISSRKPHMRDSKRRQESFDTPKPNAAQFRKTKSSRSSKSACSSSSDSCSPAVSSKSKAARRVHNEIEKKYRNSLNDRFDILRDHLPKEDQSDRSGGRCSKGEVLVFARKYIKDLEGEVKDLGDQNLLLQSQIGKWEALWIGSE